MKKKLIVFTKYAENGASSWYRILMFKDELNKYFDVKYFNFWDDNYATKYLFDKRKYALRILLQYVIASIKRWYELIFLAPKADVIFIQKDIIPKCKHLFLNRAKKAGTRIIFDQDDAMYVLRNDTSDRIAKAADIVICGNKTLKEHYIKYNKNIEIVPTVEDARKYKYYKKDTYSNKIIGWIGSKTTIKNLEIVVNPINKIISEHPEVSLLIISNTALDYDKKVNNCHFIKWNKANYIKDLSNITIGIMPLTDNEDNRGKCGFKLIQYMTLDKPVIGSGVGVNNEIIEGNGIIANTEDEWERALEKLLFDRKAYDKYVENIKTNFNKKYDYKAVSKKIIDILNK